MQHNRRQTTETLDYELFVNSQTPFETEIANVLVDTLNLEEVAASDIDPETPLFDGGLALDSVDALELALAFSQQYGVQLKSEDETSRAAFSTLRSLTDFIQTHRA